VNAGRVRDLLVVRITRTWRPPTSNEQLFECVRGVWKLPLDDAKRARLVLAVHHGAVVDVFQPTTWSSAGTKPYPTRPDLDFEGRQEFEGRRADDDVRSRLIGRTPPRSYGRAWDWFSESEALAWPTRRGRSSEVVQVSGGS